MGTPWLLISTYDANRIRRLMGDVLVGARGLAFVRYFYAHLFERNPQLRPLFPLNMADQTRKLLLTISVVVKNLDRESELQRVAAHLQAVHGDIRIQEQHIEAFLESLAFAYHRVHGGSFPPHDWRTFRRAIFSLSAKMLKSGPPSRIAAVA